MKTLITKQVMIDIIYNKIKILDDFLIGTMQLRLKFQIVVARKDKTIEDKNTQELETTTSHLKTYVCEVHANAKYYIKSHLKAIKASQHSELPLSLFIDMIMKKSVQLCQLEMATLLSRHY